MMELLFLLRIFRPCRHFLQQLKGTFILHRFDLSLGNISLNFGLEVGKVGVEGDRYVESGKTSQPCSEQVCEG